MNVDDYQALAMRTSPEGHDRLLNGCLGLIGETGEIVDLVKKWKFQSGDHAEFPKEKLIEECGDVLWYCAELATGLDDSLAKLYEMAACEFDDMREINECAPVELTAGRLACIAAKPFLTWERPTTEDEKWKVVIQAEIKSEIVGMVAMLRDFLEIHCASSLEYAMDNNITKLRKRYPDGFDPERSLHRDEGGGNE